MKATLLIAAGFALSFLLGFSINGNEDERQHVFANTGLAGNESTIIKNDKMKLGAFSISLSVKDIMASKQFYENLGFEVLGGSLEQKYLIMKSKNSLIGLFQGIFEGNILTFNPGWDENGEEMESFTEIREIQQELKRKGVKIDNEIDPSTSGPASFMVADPDGNMILFDQHR